MAEKYYQTSNLTEELDIKAATLRRYIRELIKAGYPDTKTDERGTRLFSELDRVVIINLVKKIKDEKKGVDESINYVLDRIDEYKAEIEVKKDVERSSDLTITEQNAKEIIYLLHQFKSDNEEIKNDNKQLLEDNKRLKEDLNYIKSELEAMKGRPIRYKYDETLNVNRRNIELNTDVHADDTKDITPTSIGRTTEESNTDKNNDNEREGGVMDEDKDNVHEAYTGVHEKITADVNKRNADDTKEGDERPGILGRIFNFFK